MGHIDSITVILGPPALREEKDKLAELAQASGKSVQDVYIERVDSIVEDLAGRGPGQPSQLDRVFSQLLECTVSVDDPVPTYFEKKENRYPAIVISTAEITSAGGNCLIDTVTEIFRRPDTNSTLAEQIGVCLGIESARVFVTYGPSQLQ
jgi:hypothetical protein